MYEARQNRRSGRPHAAVLTSGALLLLCCALAASQASSRGLGPAVAPDGWVVTFEPPRNWKMSGPHQSAAGSSVDFVEPSATGTGRQLTISRIPNPNRATPEDVCLAFLRERLRSPLLVLRSPPVEMRLGPLPGFRTVLPSYGVCLHAGVAMGAGGDSEAYILELQTNRALGAGDLRLCDRLAKAFRSID